MAITTGICYTFKFYFRVDCRRVILSQWMGYLDPPHTTNSKKFNSIPSSWNVYNENNVQDINPSVAYSRLGEESSDTSGE